MPGGTPPGFAFPGTGGRLSKRSIGFLSRPFGQAALYRGGFLPGMQDFGVPAELCFPGTGEKLSKRSIGFLSRSFGQAALCRGGFLSGMQGFSVPAELCFSGIGRRLLRHSKGCLPVPSGDKLFVSCKFFKIFLKLWLYSLTMHRLAFYN